ncbi:MAG: RNA-binding protein, partial [Bacteroidetes bacterium]|nr:RNA-binding protein [Bacteroidota bacterium]
MDIYVGSLPFKMKEDELREIFEKYGEVSSAKIIIDKMTRQSKGFGFVEMPDEVQAKEAIANLHGQEIMGRALVVNESQKTERTGGPRPGGGGGGGGGFRSGGDFPRRDGGSKPFNKSNDRGGDKKWDRGGRDNDRKGGGGFNKRDRDDY